jgi:hypothetical protein
MFLGQRQWSCFVFPSMLRARRSSLDALRTIRLGECQAILGGITAIRETRPLDGFAVVQLEFDLVHRPSVMVGAFAAAVAAPADHDHSL